jgi:hypothetical protein
LLDRLSKSNPRDHMRREAFLCITTFHEALPN